MLKPIKPLLKDNHSKADYLEAAMKLYSIQLKKVASKNDPNVVRIAEDMVRINKAYNFQHTPLEIADAILIAALKTNAELIDQKNLGNPKK